MLQPIEGDINDKGKHKFMIQSMFAPETVEDMEKLVSCLFKCSKIERKFKILKINYLKVIM